MENLIFDRRKYHQELLMDACDEQELEIVSNTLVLGFYTVILVAAGSGTYRLDLEDIPLQAGTVVFVRPGQVNQVEKARFDQCLFLFFERDFLDEFFQDQNFIYHFNYFHNQSSPSFLHLEPGEPFARYFETAREIWAEIKNLSQDSHHILRSLIYYLLVRLHQTYSQQYGISQDTIIEPLVLRFLRLLDRDFRQNPGVESCANQLGISRVHLNRLCRQYFSKTAHQMIREKMLSEIRKEICYSSRDFAEIAYDFHFSAPSHFTRFFRQMTGTTPQEFKEQFSKW